MTISIDELWSMSEPVLVGAYADARRQFVEKKFARDTHRARLDWLRAKTFATSAGGVTERRDAQRRYLADVAILKGTTGRGGVGQN
jgi:hypothetical protein